MNISKGVISIIMLVQATLFIDVVNAGTISNPDIIVNSQLETVSKNAADNWYAFSFSADGNILASGSSTDRSYPLLAKIYKTDLSPVEVGRTLFMNPTDTVALDAGDYYIQFFTNSDAADFVGTFTVSSTQLSPRSGLPSIEYTAGCNAGKKACIDNPESCGIDSNGDFYVIPFPVKAKD